MSARAGALGDYLRLIKFSHSVFALPFALQAAWLAARGAPPAGRLAWIVVCAVAARTAAMGFNRLVDRRIDAENPRTRERELPSGQVSAAGVALLTVGAAAVFVGGACALGRLTALLSGPVLVVLLGYSFTKRFTWLSHAALGLALALAPLGAWIAVRGDLSGDLARPLLLAAAVCVWVAGFDLIYACQDAEFDARRGLHSIPARFGPRAALGLARLLHGATVVLLAALAWRADLGWIFGAAVVLAAGLLVWEHSLVSADDLARVDQAFFTANGWVGVGLFVGLALDLALL